MPLKWSQNFRPPISLIKRISEILKIRVISGLIFFKIDTLLTGYDFFKIDDLDFDLMEE